MKTEWFGRLLFYRHIIIIIIIIIIKDNVYGAVIVTYSHCESSPDSS